MLLRGRKIRDTKIKKKNNNNKTKIQQQRKRKYFPTHSLIRI